MSREPGSSRRSLVPKPHVSAIPPKTRRPLTKQVLSAEFQFILTLLRQKYGAALQVKVTDAQWVEISVADLPATQLQAQLQFARGQFFGAAEPRMQVIQPHGSTGPGVFLHLLHKPMFGDLSTMATFGKK